MNELINNQTSVFFATIGGGLIIGLTFDVFRTIRKYIKSSDFNISIQDIIFWIISFIMIFSIIFTSNSGVLRWYEFLGIVLGIVLYIVVLSFYTTKVIEFVAKILEKIIRFIVKIISFPVKIGIKLIKIPMKFTKKMYKKIDLKDKIKKRFKRIRLKLKKI